MQQMKQWEKKIINNDNNRYFVTYEECKKALTPAGLDPSQLNLGAVIIVGGMAGIAMWLLSIPPNVSLSLIHPSSIHRCVRKANVKCRCQMIMI